MATLGWEILLGSWVLMDRSKQQQTQLRYYIIFKHLLFEATAMSAVTYHPTLAAAQAWVEAEYLLREAG